MEHTWLNQYLSHTLIFRPWSLHSGGSSGLHPSDPVHHHTHHWQHPPPHIIPGGSEHTWHWPHHTALPLHPMEPVLLRAPSHQAHSPSEGFLSDHHQACCSSMGTLCHPAPGPVHCCRVCPQSGSVLSPPSLEVGADPIQERVNIPSKLQKKIRHCEQK